MSFVVIKRLIFPLEKKIKNQVLKDSGVFEYTWTELELWLDQLARVEADQQETVIQFLERVRLMSIQRRQSNVLISRVAVLNLHEHIFI